MTLGKSSPGYEGGLCVGQRKFSIFDVTGPTSYSQTTGDPVTAPPGEYIDFINASLTVSKTYQIRFYPSATGTTRAAWAAKWFVVSGGAEVGNGVNLSAEQARVAVWGGEF